MEIEWEEPPEEAVIRARAGHVKYIDFAIALREHQERWAVLPAEPKYATIGSAQSAAQNIRRGVTKAFAPKGAYEAVASTSEDGDHKIHVRFMGMPEGAEQADPPKPAAGKGRNSRPAAGDDDEGPVRRAFAPRVRAWAKDKGIVVAPHGRIPEDIIQYYLADTGEERPAHLQAVR